MQRKNSINDLILIVYLPARNLAKAAVFNMARDASESIKRAVPEARVIAIPTQEESGRIDCINPALVDIDKWEEVKGSIDKAEKAMEALMAYNELTANPEIKFEKEYTFTYSERYTKFIELINNAKVKTITCSVSVASFIQDSDMYSANTLNVTEVDLSLPYPIGMFNNVEVIVDPNLTFDDLKVYSDNIVLFDLKEEGFTVTDLV